MERKAGLRRKGLFYLTLCHTIPSSLVHTPRGVWSHVEVKWASFHSHSVSNASGLTDHPSRLSSRQEPGACRSESLPRGQGRAQRSRCSRVSCHCHLGAHGRQHRQGHPQPSVSQRVLAALCSPGTSAPVQFPPKPVTGRGHLQSSFPCAVFLREQSACALLLSPKLGSNHRWRGARVYHKTENYHRPFRLR